MVVPPRYRTPEENKEYRRVATLRRKERIVRDRIADKRTPAERKKPLRRSKPSIGPGEMKSEHKKILLTKRKEKRESEKRRMSLSGGEEGSEKKAPARKRIFDSFGGEANYKGNAGYWTSSERSSSSSGESSKKSGTKPKGPKGPQGGQGGMSNMLLPLMLMRGGMGGNKPNDAEIKALHEQNEKDKAAAKDAIDKMKTLMVTLEELKETVKREHENLDKRNREKGCKCPSNSKIEDKVEELSDRLEESDVVEALEKCRKTLKKYKNHLEKLHGYSIYLQKLTLKIQYKLKHNINKARSLCSSKKRKKTSKKK